MVKQAATSSTRRQHPIRIPIVRNDKTLQTKSNLHARIRKPTRRPGYDNRRANDDNPTRHRAPPPDIHEEQLHGHPGRRQPGHLRQPKEIIHGRHRYFLCPAYDFI